MLREVMTLAALQSSKGGGEAPHERVQYLGGRGSRHYGPRADRAILWLWKL